MKYQINLLPKKELDFVDKIIYFALHYLRYVLVLTQIVVISVFFYRFKIDQEIIDLKDELKQKQEIVAVSQPLLDDARVVDMKTKQIREVLLSQVTFKESLSYFLSTFPADLTIQKLEIREGKFEFDATTTSPRIIQTYLERLRKEKLFKTVVLNNIQRNGLEFIAPFSLSNFQLTVGKK